MGAAVVSLVLIVLLVPLLPSPIRCRRAGRTIHHCCCCRCSPPPRGGVQHARTHACVDLVVVVLWGVGTRPSEHTHAKGRRATDECKERRFVRPPSVRPAGRRRLPRRKTQEEAAEEGARSVAPLFGCGGFGWEGGCREREARRARATTHTCQERRRIRITEGKSGPAVCRPSVVAYAHHIKTLPPPLSALSGGEAKHAAAHARAAPPPIPRKFLHPLSLPQQQATQRIVIRRSSSRSSDGCVRQPSSLFHTPSGFPQPPICNPSTPPNHAFLLIRNGERRRHTARSCFLCLSSGLSLGPPIRRGADSACSL